MGYNKPKAEGILFTYDVTLPDGSIVSVKTSSGAVPQAGGGIAFVGGFPYGVVVAAFSPSGWRSATYTGTATDEAWIADQKLKLDAANAAGLAAPVAE
jgi:hypothetical protein